MMRIKVLGKYWRLTFPKFMGELDGDCTSPTATHKGIRIAAGLRGFDFLETIIHEVMHAGNWHQWLNHRKFVSNNCLIGYSPFALAIKADFAAPSQTFVVIDRDRPGAVLAQEIYCT